MLENEYREKLIKSLLACGLPQELAEETACEKSLWFLYRNKWTSEDSAFWNFNDKLQQAADYLKISKGQYLCAALTHPQLFYQSLDSIKFNVEGAAKLLDIPAHRYIEAALKRPSLLSLSPQMVYEHFVALKKAQENGHIVSNDLMSDILNNPITLVYSAKNTTLRDFHATMFDRKRTLGDFFRKKTKSQVENEIFECLTQEFQAGASVFLDQARELHAQGILSRLPMFEMTAAPA